MKKKKIQKVCAIIFFFIPICGWIVFIDRYTGRHYMPLTNQRIDEILTN